MSEMIKERPVAVLHQGKGYTIHVASNWYIDEVNENQTFFYGPKVGKLRLGFYVTRIAKKKQTYMDVAAQRKVLHQKEKNYEVLREQDLSQEQYNAFMRRSCWYAPKADTVLFIREIFTENKDTIFILSCSIPNSKDMGVLDRATTHMMNSFRFTA